MKSRFSKTTLPNGLRIVSEHMPQTQTVALGVWVLCGARDEESDMTGISHLLEHLTFKGTPTRSAYDIAVAMESLGGHLNAVTDREYTCYYGQCLAIHFDKALDLLADMVQNSILSQADIDLEKQVVLEEILNLEDSPEDQVLDDLTAIMYPDHGMGASILGTHESLENISRAHLQAYRDKWHSASNIIVSVAGGFQHEQVVQWVSRYFENLPTGVTSERDSVTIGAVKQTVTKKDISQAHITYAVETVSYAHEHRYALVLANTLLGSGMSSLLFQELREKRALAYSVYSWLDFYCDTGQWGVYYGISQKNKNEALELLTGSIEHLGQQVLSGSELARIVNQIVYGFRIASEDPQVRMQRLAKMEMYWNHFLEDEEVIHRFKSVKSHQIQECIHRYLKPDTWFNAIIEPRS